MVAKLDNPKAAIIGKTTLPALPICPTIPANETITVARVASPAAFDDGAANGRSDLVSTPVIPRAPLDLRISPYFGREG
jgi:hypothetical protein